MALLDPVKLRLLRRHAVIPPSALSDIADEVGAAIEHSRLYIAYVCWGPALLACIVIVALRSVIGFRFFSLLGLALMINLGVTIIGMIMTWRNARHSRLEHVMSVFLRHLRCPHCGYDLRMLPTHPEDGATVCPECGSAWRPENA